MIEQSLLRQQHINTIKFIYLTMFLVVFLRLGFLTDRFFITLVAPVALIFLGIYVLVITSKWLRAAGLSLWWQLVSLGLLGGISLLVSTYYYFSISHMSDGLAQGYAIIICVLLTLWLLPFFHCCLVSRIISLKTKVAKGKMLIKRSSDKK